MAAAGTAYADTLFFDDFEIWSSPYSGWVAPTPNPSPINSSQYALNFSAFKSGGDTGSIGLSLTTGLTYRFSFDYLGIANADAYAGISTEVAARYS